MKIEADHGDLLRDASVSELLWAGVGRTASTPLTTVATIATLSIRVGSGQVRNPPSTLNVVPVT